MPVTVDEHLAEWRARTKRFQEKAFCFVGAPQMAKLFQEGPAL